MTTNFAEQVSITYCDTAAPAELYQHYPGQTQAQTVEVQFDLEDGELCARYNPEIGNAMPARAWHGIVRTWDVPAILTSSAMNELLEEIAPRAAALRGESEVSWDGSNHIGTLSEAGHDLEQQIRDYLAEYAEDLSTGRVDGLDAADWLAGTSLATALTDEGIELTANTTDTELDEIEEQLLAGAEASNPDSVLIVEGLDEMLTEYRNELREQVRERLTEVRDELEALRAERDNLIRRIYSWSAGDTDRSLEGLAGVSRATIARVRRDEDTAATHRIITSVEDVRVTEDMPDGWTAGLVVALPFERDEELELDQQALYVVQLPTSEEQWEAVADAALATSQLRRVGPWRRDPDRDYLSADLVEL